MDSKQSDAYRLTIRLYLGPNKEMTCLTSFTVAVSSPGFPDISKAGMDGGKQFLVFLQKTCTLNKLQVGLNLLKLILDKRLSKMSILNAKAIILTGFMYTYVTC